MIVVLSFVVALLVGAEVMDRWGGANNPLDLQKLRVGAAEVMVDGEAVHLVRHREPLASLWEGEAILP